MLGHETTTYRAVCNLVSAGLGLVLLASPWMLAETSNPTALWSAVFGGALVTRLGASAALCFREWKAWTEIATGLWLAGTPWLFHFEGLSQLTRIHHVVPVTRLPPPEAVRSHARRRTASADGNGSRATRQPYSRLSHRWQRRG